VGVFFSFWGVVPVGGGGFFGGGFLGGGGGGLGSSVLFGLLVWGGGFSE